MYDQETYGDSEIHVADDNWRLLEVYKGEWTAPLTRYVDGAGIDEHLMIERDANGDGDFEDGDRWYFLTDDLGSTARLVKQVEGPISPTPAVNYDPYGLPQIAVDQEMPLFAGMAWDPETGLYYCRNRFYHPQLGRFLSPDPKVAPQGAPSPQGDAQRRLARLNPASSLYAYAAGRPGYFTDPLGLDEDCGCKGANAGATSPNAAGGGSDGGTTPTEPNEDDNPNVVETTTNIIKMILEWEPLPLFPGTSDPALNLLNVRAMPSYEPTNFERETNKLLQEMAGLFSQNVRRKGDWTLDAKIAAILAARSNPVATLTYNQLVNEYVLHDDLGELSYGRSMEIHEMDYIRGRLLKTGLGDYWKTINVCEPNIKGLGVSSEGWPCKELICGEVWFLNGLSIVTLDGSFKARRDSDGKMWVKDVNLYGVVYDRIDARGPVEGIGDFNNSPLGWLAESIWHLLGDGILDTDFAVYIHIKYQRPEETAIPYLPKPLPPPSVRPNAALFPSGDLGMWWWSRYGILY